MDADALAFALPPLAGDWLLTYLVHSTLLLGGAWIVTRWARRLPVAAQETLWRSALFGALLTASVQVALGYESLGGRVAVPAASPPALEAQAMPPAPFEHTATLPTPAEDPVRSLSEATRLPVPPPAPAHDAALLDHLPLWLALLWSTGAALAILRSLRTRWRLRSRLAGRTPLERGPLRETLDRLAPRGRIRLSTARELAGPIAFGVRRPEICLPERAARDLSAAQQEAMLAHELAHHRRRDPLLLALGRTVQAVFFFQPLNALAVRRLRDAAEMLCDAWAVEQTGQRRALAECLAIVAGWMVRGEAPLAVPAMAQRDSAVEHRVRMLLGGHAARPTPRLGRLALLLAPLVLVAALAPAVGRAAALPTPPQAESTRPAGHDDLDAALDALDRELEALAAEVDALAHLLAQVEGAPLALTRGAESLRAHLVALRADRTALVQRIWNESESKR